MAAVPRLFITQGCPYVMKVLTFLNDAGLRDKVELTADSPENRAYAKEKGAAHGYKAASFPALDLPDRIIMHPDVDQIIEYLAETHGVDMSSLYVYNDYCTGVFPRYVKMVKYVIKKEGGWPKLFPSIGVQNLLILGSTGMVGSRLTTEAKQRGHKVTPVSRKGDVSVDANDAAALEAVLKEKQTNVLVVAVGPIRPDPAAGPALKDTYESIITAARAVGEISVFFVGGAGSLQAGDQGMVVDQPWFPEHVKPEAMGHADGLAYLNTVEDVKWSYLSPPPMIQPGKKTVSQMAVDASRIVVGDGDQMVGQSISAEDYAIAALDEIDQGFPHARKRFAVANGEGQ